MKILWNSLLAQQAGDLALLLLWHGLDGSLAQEFPQATGMGKKKKKSLAGRQVVSFFFLQRAKIDVAWQQILRASVGFN